MNLSNKTISFRLGFLIIVLLVFEGVLVYFGITRAQGLLNRLDSIARIQLPTTIDLLSAKTNIDNARATVIEAILSNQANAKDKIPNLVKKTKEIAIEMFASAKEMEKLGLDAEMNQKVRTFATEIKIYGDICVSLIEAVQKENWDLILDLNPKFQDSFDKLILQFVYFDEFIRSNASEVTKQGSDIIKILSLISSIGIIISLAVSFIVFRSLKKSLIMILETTSTTVKNSFRIVEDLSNRSAELSQTTASQLAAVRSSMHILAEISSSIFQTNVNAKDSLLSAQSVQEKTTEGQVVMKKMKTSVEDIQLATGRFEEVQNTIKAIGERTSTIKDIVERTQMLSFNATLEAERAGEQGKAFSVVAQEVGKLAEISGKASLEIETLIHESEAKVQEVLELIQSRVDTGASITKDSVQVFEEIATQIKIVNEQIRLISEFSVQQDEATKLANVSMAEINNHSKSNAQTTSKVSITADELKAQSHELNDVAENLRFLILGKNTDV